MAKIEPFYAPPGGVHTQEMSTQTGTQASGRDFYAINQTMDQAGQINFQPLVQGLQHAAGAMEEQAVSISKIWAYDVGQKGELEFRKQIAAGADPATVEKQFVAWQQKSMKEAPSGLAARMFNMQTDDLGRSLILHSIRATASANQAERTQVVLENRNIGITEAVAMHPRDSGKRLNEISSITAEGIQARTINAPPELIARDIQEIQTVLQTSATPEQKSKLYKDTVKRGDLNEVHMQQAISKPEEILEYAKENKGFIPNVTPKQSGTILKNANYYSVVNQLPGSTSQEAAVIGRKLSESGLLPKENLQAMTKLQSHFHEVDKTRHEDPALWASQSKEGQYLFNQMNLMQIASGDKTPESKQAFINATNDFVNYSLSRQAQQGLPWNEVSVLHKDARLKIQSDINNDLLKGNVSGVVGKLNAIKEQYGDNYHMVENELMINKKDKLNALPWAVQTLSDLPQKNFALFADSLNPENRQAIKDANVISQETANKYFQSSGDFEKWDKSIMLISGNTQTRNNIKTSIKDFAEYLLDRRIAKNSDDAMNQSTNIIMGDVYNTIEVNGRNSLVKKTEFPDASKLESGQRTELINIANAPGMVFKPVQGMVGEVATDYNKNDILNNGFWVQSGKTFFLYVDRGNNVFAPVQDDKGNKITRTSDQFLSNKSSIIPPFLKPETKVETTPTKQEKTGAGEVKSALKSSAEFFFGYK